MEKSTEVDTRDGTGSRFLTRDPTRPDPVVERCETNPRQWLDCSIIYLSGNLKPCLHDTAGCQTGCTTGLTTGLTTVLNEQPLFVQSVVKPGCTTGLTTGCIV